MPPSIQRCWIKLPGKHEARRAKSEMRSQNPSWLQAILAERDAYFLELSRYIHVNPVRAKIVARPEEYERSSYGAYVGERKDSLVATEVILGLMGARGTCGGGTGDSWRRGWGRCWRTRGRRLWEG